MASVSLLLMEHVEGTVVGSRGAALALTPSRRSGAGLSLSETLGVVHAVDLVAAGLAYLSSHGPYAQRQLRRFLRQWDSTGIWDQREIHAFADPLTRYLPPQLEITLAHGGFHLANVILGLAVSTVTAILDWELCTLGDAIADLGTLLTYWPDREDEPGVPVTFPGLPRFPSRAALVARYAEASGRDVEHVGFWFALGCWKVAVISEGIRSRGKNTRAVAGGPSEADVDEMLQRAVRVADEYGLPA